jgi:hypothetical protein
MFLIRYMKTRIVASDQLFSFHRSIFFDLSIELRALFHYILYNSVVVIQKESFSE